MGNRNEPRTQASAQVKVYGIDVNGNPFKQSARAYNLSLRGACLEGIGCLRGPGETIEIEHRGKKARFVVVWVGIPGTLENNRIGVKNRDQQDIWKMDLPKPQSDEFQSSEEFNPQQIDTGNDQQPAFPPLLVQLANWDESAGDRRKYRRYAVDGSATFQVKKGEVRTWGKLGDVSAGGCYVESYVPFPVQTELEMILEVRDLRVVAEGVVTIVYPALGMGITFTKVTDECKQQLEQLAAIPD